jgi:antitoxin VapB
MALNIKDPEADRVVRELAEVTGESITAAITVAARERLDRVRGVAPAQERARRIRALADEFSKLPVLDDRSPDEILGYDEDGLPS